MSDSGSQRGPIHGPSPEISEDGQGPVTPTGHHTGNSESPKNQGSTGLLGSREDESTLEFVRESESLGLAQGAGAPEDQWDPR